MSNIYDENKKPNCKCLINASDVYSESNVLRVVTSEFTHVWLRNAEKGCRIIELKNNFCPQCGVKYSDRHTKILNDEYAEAQNENNVNP